MRQNKTLRFDSEEQNLFFTSDPHFQHHNIIKYCDRPFHTKEEMDSTLIKNWNAVVGERDIVFVGGDFCMGGSKSWSYILDALNGKKFLALGNHDKNTTNKWEHVDNIINLLIDDPEVKDGQRITLCHYPMLSWYQSHRGAWQLFGHVHGESTFKYFEDDGFTVKGRITPNQLDIGVDSHNFTPLSYQEVKTIITKQNLGR